MCRKVFTTIAPLASLKSTLGNMKANYAKEIVVAGTPWRSSRPNPAYTFMRDSKSIASSPYGQTRWMQDVANVVSLARENGLFSWELAWLDNQPPGGSCLYNLIFKLSGMAMSSLQISPSIPVGRVAT